MKNGTTRRGKQNYKCRDCGRPFVENPLSESWLQGDVNQCAESVPRQVQVVPKPKAPLTVQMDELQPSVDDKGNKQ